MLEVDMRIFVAHQRVSNISDIQQPTVSVLGLIPFVVFDPEQYIVSFSLLQPLFPKGLPVRLDQ
jgi:hypothetical protein